MKDDGEGKPCACIPLSPRIFVMERREDEDKGGGRVTEVEEGGGEQGEVRVGLHVSWPSVAGVSLALGKSESVSRLDMRSSSACTSLRPSFEPASSVGGCKQTYILALYHSKDAFKPVQYTVRHSSEWLRHNAINTKAITHG